MRVLEGPFALEGDGLLALLLGALFRAGRAVLSHVVEVLLVGIELRHEERVVLLNVLHHLVEALQVARRLGDQRLVVQQLLLERHVVRRGEARRGGAGRIASDTVNEPRTHPCAAAQNRRPQKEGPLAPNIDNCYECCRGSR